MYKNIEMPYNDIFHLYFPKLSMISFRQLLNLTKNDVDDFLKLNPQLRKIGQIACTSTDGGIFQSIAMHVPQIETIEIDRVSIINEANLEYIGQLNNLRTPLKLC